MIARLSFAILSFLAIVAWTVLGPGLAQAQNYDTGMAAYEAGDYKRAAQIWDSLALGGVVAFDPFG